MSNGYELFELIALAIVAAFILYRLGSVLGKKTGNEKPGRPNGLGRRERSAPAEPGQDNIISLPNRGDERPAAAVNFEPYLVSGSDATASLQRIAQADRSFEPASFLAGAKVAYEMIVTAFAEGDKDTLKSLLDRDIYQSFAGEIDRRANEGMTASTSIVGVRDAKISAAELKGRNAEVGVRFEADMITSVKDSGGVVVEGDEKAIRDVADLWTFGRDTRSGDPNWRLIATGEG